MVRTKTGHKYISPWAVGAHPSPRGSHKTSLVFAFLHLVSAAHTCSVYFISQHGQKEVLCKLNGTQEIQGYYWGKFKSQKWTHCLGHFHPFLLYYFLNNFLCGLKLMTKHGTIAKYRTHLSHKMIKLVFS